MNLEEWVIDLFKEIKKASDSGQNVDIHLEKEFVKEIAEEYDKVKWVEIY